MIITDEGSAAPKIGAAFVICAGLSVRCDDQAEGSYRIDDEFHFCSTSFLCAGIRIVVESYFVSV